MTDILKFKTLQLQSSSNISKNISFKLIPVVQNQNFEFNANIENEKILFKEISKIINAQSILTTRGNCEHWGNFKWYSN